jgi:hypothetical protein
MHGLALKKKEKKKAGVQEERAIITLVMAI